MATTTPDNIWTPDAGDDYALTTDLAAMADTVQDALNTRAGKRSGSGAPSVLSGDSLGDVYTDTTNGIQYWFNGTAWLTNVPGLNLITNTAYPTGVVSFTSAATVTMDGVFTSRFRNYLIKVSFTGTSTRAGLRLRVGGVAATGATDYKNQYVYNNTDTALSTSYEQISQWFTAPAVGNRHSGEIELYNPSRAASTDIISDLVILGHPTISAVSGHLVGQHLPAVAYDGFSLISASGTITGTLSVYGYAG